MLGAEILRWNNGTLEIYDDFIWIALLIIIVAAIRAGKDIL